MDRRTILGGLVATLLNPISKSSTGTSVSIGAADYSAASLISPNAFMTLNEMKVLETLKPPFASQSVMSKLPQSEVFSKKTVQDVTNTSFKSIISVSIYVDPSGVFVNTL